MVLVILEEHCIWNICSFSSRLHGKQEPIFGDRKVFTNPSACVKYVIKFEIAANVVAKSNFARNCGVNKSPNQKFKVEVAR